MSVGMTTLRLASAIDRELILAWWGIPEVRRFTTTRQQPSFGELLDQLNQPGRRDFMIIYQGRRVGRTCLTEQKEFEELSLYIGEVTLHGHGIGTTAIGLTLQQASKQVRARVVKDNAASLKAFLANEFSILKEDGTAVWLAHPGGTPT